MRIISFLATFLGLSLMAFAGPGTMGHHHVGFYHPRRDHHARTYRYNRHYHHRHSYSFRGGHHEHLHRHRQTI